MNVWGRWALHHGAERDRALGTARYHGVVCAQHCHRQPQWVDLRSGFTYPVLLTVVHMACCWVLAGLSPGPAVSTQSRMDKAYS